MKRSGINNNVSCWLYQHIIKSSDWRSIRRKIDVEVDLMTKPKIDFSDGKLDFKNALNPYLIVSNIQTMPWIDERFTPKRDRCPGDI